MKTFAKRTGGYPFVAAACYTLLALAAVILPIIMSLNESPYFAGGGSVYFGLCAGVALAVIAAVELRRCKGAPPEKLLPAFAFFFISFSFLLFLRECWGKS